MNNAQHYLGSLHHVNADTTYTLPDDWARRSAVANRRHALLAVMRRDVPVERVLLSISRPLSDRSPSVNRL